MRKYSTPTQRFALECNNPSALLDLECFLTYGRKLPNGRFEPLFDATFTAKQFDEQIFLYAALTQEQTAMFNDNEIAYVQLSAIAKSGLRVVSEMAAVRFTPTIKAQVIAWQDPEDTDTDGTDTEGTDTGDTSDTGATENTETTEQTETDTQTTTQESEGESE